MTDTSKQPPANGDEFYEEPPGMTARDTWGVVAALAALLIIGVAAYVWITPGIGFADLNPLAKNIKAGEAPIASSTAAPDAEHLRCEYCGMFADKSLSRVMVGWSDGTEHHYDSWDCAINHGRETGLDMANVAVVRYDPEVDATDDPEWLKAESAVFLYGTSPVAGSMPPYVAAFRDTAEAERAKLELGGERVDFPGLMAKWEPALTKVDKPGPDQADEGHPDHGEMADLPEPMLQEAEEQPGAEPAKAEVTPDQHDHEMNCSYCGMFADKSQSHSVAYWSDGSHTHHDCWDCLFSYGKDESLPLVSAMVLLHGSDNTAPEWLDADGAWYLFDTNPLKGSMPPFVAAFRTRADAEAARPELGGEVVDFSGLMGNWE